jgi:hypothetical protein
VFGSGAWKRMLDADLAAAAWWGWLLLIDREFKRQWSFKYV